MRVLSLFDGISCGMLALNRAGIPVKEYHAFEIDKYAMEVSKKNFPEIVQHGNVFDGNFKDFQGYDLLIGGSPCTYWSISKKNREITSDGEGFRLFMEYVRALNESKCRYFLYENNYSIHRNIKNEISEKLGVQPIMINSALVSAQQRKRCYWTNIPDVIQPEDKGILLNDILENAVGWHDKSYCMTASYSKAVLHNSLKRNQRTMVAVPVYGAAQRGRYKENGSTEQHIEIRNDGKSNCLTTVQKDSLICKPVRIGEYGKGGQGQRIYSVHGKSVTLSANGGGQGAKTGLYKIDLPDGDYIIRKLTPIEAERLQTLPDNYTAGISDTQRYKCIGNAWTVDVIAHIFKGLEGKS
ncbi:MAG: DNA (cytosine-5-)-methyltransferase [Oscillospiraceae bacterium]